ncbi:MAG: hypothetical protein J6S85_18415 [Methanobrevibacter sp.]|nr:hypothetical protein [Methanobrevibacter sp.]
MQYKNFRSNPMRSRNGRPTSGHCVECGRLTSEALGGKRVTTPSQRNGVWVCEAHRGRRNLHDYCEENSTRVGSGNADNISISLELESMGVSTHARAYLVDNNFIATSDSTVDIEYKSPIYTSEQPLAKIIGGIEYMDTNDNYQFKVNHHRCGLHTHFGFIDNRYNFRRLEEDYEFLFKQLNTIVCDLTDEERAEIFGRSWGEYNEPLSFRYPDRHENWINIQHNYSIEIRMPRFETAIKYMKFLKTFKKMFKALNTHYISKGAENNVNHIRNAEKASRKMCAIFCEAYNIVCANGHYEIRNEVEQTQTTEETSSVSVAPISNSSERLIYNPRTCTFEIASLSTTPDSATIVYCDTPSTDVRVYRERVS